MVDKRGSVTRRDLVRYLKDCEIEDAAGVYRRARSSLVHTRDVPPELNVLSIGFFEYIKTFQIITLLSMSRVAVEGSSFTEKAAFTVSSALAGDAGAILTLCRSGFDVQARSLLRGLGEKVDLLVAVFTDEATAQAYVEHSDFEGSRKFFFNSISKGRLRKLATKKMQEFSGHPTDLDEVFEWFRGEWRDDLELMLGAAVHPNHSVGMITLFPNISRGRSDATGLDGHPNNGSLRTINDALRLTLPIAFAAINGRVFPPKDENDRREFEHDRTKLSQLARFGLIMCIVGWIDKETKISAIRTV